MTFAELPLFCSETDGKVCCAGQCKYLAICIRYKKKYKELPFETFRKNHGIPIVEQRRQKLTGWS